MVSGKKCLKNRLNPRFFRQGRQETVMVRLPSTLMLSDMVYQADFSLVNRVVLGTWVVCCKTYVLRYLAMPKNTAKQLSTSTDAFASMCPKAGPTFFRFMVMALSTITCDGFCKPFSALGGMVIRNSGVATSVLVTGSASQCF